MSIQERESQYTSGLYTKRPIAIVRGEGARLWDSDGKEYIDCVGAQGAASPQPKGFNADRAGISCRVK
jgi:acetylornithine/LysW-gamma-L-lysine aminotransferase